MEITHRKIDIGIILYIRTCGAVYSTIVTDITVASNIRIKTRASYVPSGAIFMVPESCKSAMIELATGSPWKKEYLLNYILESC
jgi:hypothetical protein